MKMQKIGGWAVIAMMCLTVIVLLMVLPVYRQYGMSEMHARLDPVKVLAAYVGSPMTYRLLIPATILIHIFQLLVALGLQERMKSKAPHLMRLLVIMASVAFTMVLANAMVFRLGLALMAKSPDISIYKPFFAIIGGLSNASDVGLFGGILLLGGLGALSTGLLPRTLGCMLLASGIGGCISLMLGTTNMVVAAIGTGIAVLSLIWLAVILIRKPVPDSTQSCIEAA